MDIWQEGQYQEIWVCPQETEENQRTMTALINGDAGFSSRNPDYPGTEDDGETMEFMLSNGQLDRYPLAYALPVEQVKKALDFFEKRHELPDFITWHDDAEP